MPRPQHSPGLGAASHGDSVRLTSKVVGRPPRRPGPCRCPSSSAQRPGRLARIADEFGLLACLYSSARSGICDEILDLLREGQSLEPSTRLLSHHVSLSYGGNFNSHRFSWFASRCRSISVTFCATSCSSRLEKVTLPSGPVPLKAIGPIG